MSLNCLFRYPANYLTIKTIYYLLLGFTKVKFNTVHIIINSKSLLLDNVRENKMPPGDLECRKEHCGNKDKNKLWGFLNSPH